MQHAAAPTHNAAPGRRALTPMEMRVVRHLCHREGATLAEVAKLLDIEKGTAGVHLQNAYKKLKVKNRVQLYALAVKMGWVPCTCPKCSA
ncbi:MAG: LuxR C-terminal-related transcriptional regulator [Flavobacteriales bacterium]